MAAKAHPICQQNQPAAFYDCHPLVGILCLADQRRWLHGEWPAALKRLDAGPLL